MKDSTLTTLAPLLSFLRSFDSLEETPGKKFLLRGKDFIHFHEDPDGLWADVKLANGRSRLSVATIDGQAEVMEKIAAKLELFDAQHQPQSSKRRAAKR